MNNRITTKRIVMTALLAALTVAGSAIRVTLPLSIAGTTSFHLGNILCALSGILLGPWFGGLAAGMGSAIYDLMNPLYAPECWITFITKAAYGVVVGLIAWKNRRPWHARESKTYIRLYIATIVGALTYAVLYLSKGFFYDGLLLSGLTANAALINVAAKLPATAFNAVVAIIGAPLLSIAVSKALDAAHLSLD